MWLKTFLHFFHFWWFFSKESELAVRDATKNWNHIKDPCSTYSNITKYIWSFYWHLNIMFLEKISYSIHWKSRCDNGARLLASTTTTESTVDFGSTLKPMFIQLGMYWVTVCPIHSSHFLSAQSLQDEKNVFTHWEYFSKILR